jgi:hypothetical protein
MTDDASIDELTAFHYALEDAVAELPGEPFTEYLTKDSEDGATCRVRGGEPGPGVSPGAVRAAAPTQPTALLK